MKLKNRFYTGVALMMSLLMSNIPSTAIAQGMISTSILAAELTRAEAQSNVENFLQKEEVRAELIKRGVSMEEATSRLASLSTSELRDFSQQIETARAGGDILVTILVVVLIIFLIKRI